MKDLTILIPTHNRYKELKRLIKYFQLNKDFKNIPVVIAHSDKDINLKEINGDNLKHLLYHENISPFLKISLALKNVTTKYVILCADDDFLVLENLPPMLNFLNENKDYAAVVGKQIGFNPINFSYLYNPKFRDIEDYDAVKRIANYNNSFSLFYSLTYAAYYKEIFSYIAYCSDNVLGERFLCNNLLFCGKVKFMPRLLNAREINPNSQGAQDLKSITKGIFTDLSTVLRSKGVPLEWLYIPYLWRDLRHIKNIKRAVLN